MIGLNHGSRRGRLCRAICRFQCPMSSTVNRSGLQGIRYVWWCLHLLVLGPQAGPHNVKQANASLLSHLSLSSDGASNFIEVRLVSRGISWLWSNYSPPNRDLFLLVHPPGETTMGFSGTMPCVIELTFFDGMDAAHDRWVTISHQ
ncbi:unnamed protein product, partial [Vitis vinifera]|uniref:Uncharacterized protein n=1 Tax=Vitis vinifera TaxID=29760 RepID=D7U454_VITVI